MGVVCTLPCLNSGRFEVFESKAGLFTFHYLVNHVSPEILSNAYSAVEFHIQHLSAFVNRWLAYQTLWDTQVSEVASATGGDVNKWQELIVEVSSYRYTGQLSGGTTKHSHRCI